MVTGEGAYIRQELRDHAALAECAREWRELPQAMASPLLAPEWSAAALGTLHARAATLCLRKDGAIAALAPLASERLAGIARLELLGARALHEPSGFLHRDRESLERLCAMLVDLGRPIVLQRVAANEPLRTAFAAAGRGRGKLLDVTAAAAPFVDFPAELRGDFAAFEARLSARRRQDYRRARRRLEREGPVTFDLRVSSATSVDAELTEAMRLEAAGWKERRGSALARNTRLAAFFRDMARRSAARGELRICFLRVGGRAIATQVCIEHARRWWILKIGFDESWAEFSPGIQLMWDVLRNACEARLAGVEMLGSAEEWLQIWTRETREFRTLVFYPYNLRGMTALALDGAGAVLRRLKRRRE